MLTLTNLANYICKIHNRETFEYGYYDKERSVLDDTESDEENVHYNDYYRDMNTLKYTINWQNIGFTKYFHKNRCDTIYINIDYQHKNNLYSYHISNCLRHRNGDFYLMIYTKYKNEYGNRYLCSINSGFGGINNDIYSLNFKYYDPAFANLLWK